MREVSTYAGTGEQGIHCSIDRVTRARYIVQTAADPEGNLLQQSRRIDVAPEFGCGETEELISLGVAARTKVHRQVVLGHRRGVGLPHDRRGVVDLEVTHRNVQFVDAVTVNTADLQGLQRLSVQDK